MNRTCILASLALLLATTTGQAQDLRALLSRLPDETNAIAVINVEAIYNSPIAVKEEWAKKVAHEPQPGVGSIPPYVKMAVLGTQWAPGGRTVADVLGVATAKQAFDMEKLAKREEGTVETVNGQKVVHSPRNVFFAPLGEGFLGMMYPANRQDLARWMKEASAPTQPQLPPYLMSVADAAANEPVIVMAVDLADLLDPKMLKLQVGMSKAIVGKNVDVNALANLVAGAKGATLTIRFTDVMRAEIRIDFSDSPRPFLEVLRPLFTEALEVLGVGLEGLNTWNMRVDGNHMRMESRVHPNDMRQIMSLIELPSPHLESPGDGAQLTPEQTALMASLRYYREVSRLVDDLKVERDRARTHGRNAQWHDNFAKRIEGLPTLNVDPELLAWGRSVANRVRGLAASLRGIGLQISTLDQQKQSFTWVDPGAAGSTWGGGWGWGGWAYGSYYRPSSVWTQNNFQQVRTQQAETVTRGVEDRNIVWNSIEADSLAVRTKMTQKFNFDFSSQATFRPDQNRK